ncbi:hypothetical protein SY83_02340 [Paenibacillus swuensis]|uniref:HD domain-containing protein n=1 Tax=Paenibacillus swuensis TaxID=1178515 RepID=A0A172TEN6_9BACL|nr:hypothetical protein [Paenibacillus swuensis]ANE45357.1 hypothetical protein SY83_02340 [Paenibacillus swuensis]
MYIFGINEVLLTHFKKASGAAGYLRFMIPGLAVELHDFFQIRSDIQRIQKAESIAQKILKLTDFSEMLPIRSEVATLELKRRITYNKQTDHTAHTLYLFLLGIYVYDTVTILKGAIDRSINSSKPIRMFIFQWTFASLLHDIGYLYSEYKDEQNQKSVLSYDNLYNQSSIEKFIGNMSQESMLLFKGIWESFVGEYPLKPTNNINIAEQIINELDNIPWLRDLGFNTTSGLDILSQYEATGVDLRDYTYFMAKNGYNEIPVVDHGVASGLMLFKYSTVWYWLSNETKKYPSLHEEFTRNSQYPRGVLSKHIIPACSAVAHHNISKVKYDYSTTPLLYFSVLCDELQIWDRFLSGSQHIENWNTIEHCMSEQILTEKVNNAEGTDLFNFSVSYNYYEKITKILNLRLNEWDKFVNLSSI